MKRIILSNDATYANGSELSNAIGCPIIFRGKDPKGMWKVAKNVSYGYKNRYSELNQADEIIILGAISFGALRNDIRGFDDLVKRKKTKIIITGTYYFLRPQECNRLYKQLGLIVYCMPGLLKYRQNLPTIPYYQPFDLKNYPIKKNDELTICHTPYHSTKLQIKGSHYINKIIKQLPMKVRYEFIMNKSWEGTLKIRSQSHITIDMIIKVGNYTGGIGKSGLEALWLKSALITTGNSFTSKYFNSPPVIFTTIENFKQDLLDLIEDKDYREDQIKFQRKWAEKYLSYEFVAKHVTR